ncbi:hypothetical protein [Clostridium sp.]|uniref:hypothetical protein n=3 Tax=Clostridium TaxID=1485 RepID=UPI0025BF6BED|nr:hypothetical protein [Clostridium sp.]MCI9304139.1 hypothetical protein [Clostridium sp.]
MNNFKISIKYFKETILIALTIIQIIVMIYYSKVENSKEVYNEINYLNKEKLTFNNISNEININENIEIMEVEDLGEEWYIKLMISGNNKKIKEAINKLDESLDNFQIYNYDISGKDNILTVILELYR